MRFIPDKVRILFRQILASRARKSEMAGGAAIGMFVAWLPIFGIQSYVCLALAALLKKNPLMAVLVSWLNNPLTALPMYGLCFWLGRWFYPGDVRFDLSSMTLTAAVVAGRDLIIPLVIGGVILGLLSAAVGYFVCLRYYDVLRSLWNQRQERVM